MIPVTHSQPTVDRAAGGQSGDTSPPAGFSRRRYHEVDILRLIAAVCVVGFHYLFFATRMDPVRAHSGFHDPGGVFRYGFLGVMLFFVISGFVILNSAWRRKPISFVASRVGRLYPAFWVACTLSALIMAFAPVSTSDISVRQWALNLSMFSHAYSVDYVDGVYWTLTIELAFYLVILAMVRFGLTPNRVVALCLGWTALGVATMFHAAPDWLQLVLVPYWSCYFVAGMLFALIARYGWKWRYTVPLAASYLLCSYVAVRYTLGIGRRYDVHYSSTVVLLVIAAVFMIFIALVSGVRMPGARWLAGAAGLTYPLYLIHENIGFIGIETLHRLGLNRWLVLGIVFATVVGLAWLLHVAVENRFAKPLAALVTRVLTGVRGVIWRRHAARVRTTARG